MHKFLRAIGFSDLKKKDLDGILGEIIAHPEVTRVTTNSEGEEFAELSRQFLPHMGITVRGTYEADDFRMEYYYPYLAGTEVSTEEQVDIEKHAEKESYAGVCDEIRLGVTLIFYMQNVADYLFEVNRSKANRTYKGVVLSALSTEGKILLPMEKRERREQGKDYSGRERTRLIAEAREGNEEAIENLTVEDMDMYSILSKRVQYEDILSIVNSCFMPYGIESDQYAIIGEILSFAIHQNSRTKEAVYCIKVLCNDIIFDVGISEKDLMGEPKIGRRFKGSIWMQGSVCLELVG